MLPLNGQEKIPRRGFHDGGFESRVWVRSVGVRELLVLHS